MEKKTKNLMFLNSAKHCCENSRRLLNEAELLEFENPRATQYFLSMIAQEEAAKAFILYLVSIEALPWTPFLLRATRDHKCKQLVGIILDYMSPDTDEFLQRLEKRERILPPSVVDAMNILCHEKIRRWESNSWVWAEDPEYDKEAMSVADGKRDKDKQRGLYVGLNKEGQVESTPKDITETLAENEYEKGCRFESCVRGLVEEDKTGFAFDGDKIEASFKTLFSEQNVFIEKQET